MVVKKNRCCHGNDRVPSVPDVAAHWANNTRDNSRSRRIDRIPCQISREEFVIRYEQPRIPVILTGCAVDWAASWTSWEQLRGALAPTDRVKATFDPRQQEWTVAPWSDITAAMDDHRFFYIFDQLRDPHVQAVMETAYQVPPQFRQVDLYEALHDFPPRYGRRRWFVMGVAHSGTEPHVDPSGTDAWNTVLQGHKWWIIYPNHGTIQQAQDVMCDETCSVQNRTIAHWWTSVGMSTDDDDETDKPWHVLQSPGDTLYIPHGMVHAVYNLENCIGITENYAAPTNVTTLWEAVVREGTVTHRQSFYFFILNDGQRRTLQDAGVVIPSLHLGLPGIVVSALDYWGVFPALVVAGCILLAVAGYFVKLWERQSSGGSTGGGSHAAAAPQTKKRVIRKIIRQANKND